MQIRSTGLGERNQGWLSLWWCGARKASTVFRSGEQPHCGEEGLGQTPYGNEQFRPPTTEPRLRKGTLTLVAPQQPMLPYFCGRKTSPRASVLSDSFFICCAATSCAFSLLPGVVRIPSRPRIRGFWADHLCAHRRECKARKASQLPRWGQLAQDFQMSTKGLSGRQ